MYKNWTKNLHNEGKVDSSLFDVICVMLTALVTQIQSLYT